MKEKLFILIVQVVLLLYSLVLEKPLTVIDNSDVLYSINQSVTPPQKPHP